MAKILLAILLPTICGGQILFGIQNNSFGEPVQNIRHDYQVNFQPLFTETENISQFFDNDPFFDTPADFFDPPKPNIPAFDPFFADIFEIERKFNLSELNTHFDPLHYNSEEVRDQIYKRVNSFSDNDDKSEGQDYSQVTIIGNVTNGGNDSQVLSPYISNHRLDGEAESLPAPPVVKQGRSFISSVIVSENNFKMLNSWLLQKNA